MKFKLTILMTIFLSGCGSKSSLSIYQSTEAQAVVENPSLIVLPIGMEVYGLNQDSQHELRSDWSDAASSTFAPALKEILRTRREIQQVVFMDDLESEIGAVGAEFVRQVEMYSVITQLAERELSAYVIPQEIMAQLDLGDFEADYALFVGLSYLQSRLVNRVETAAGVILLAGILFGDEADEPSTPAPAPAPAPSGQESNVQIFLAESHTALIDLRDGRVIWANHDPSLHRLATHTDELHLEDEWRFWTSGMGSMGWTLGEDFLSEFPLWVAAAPDDGKLWPTLAKFPSAILESGIPVSGTRNRSTSGNSDVRRLTREIGQKELAFRKGLFQSGEGRACKRVDLNSISRAVRTTLLSCRSGDYFLGEI